MLSLVDCEAMAVELSGVVVFEHASDLVEGCDELGDGLVGEVVGQFEGGGVFVVHVVVHGWG